MKALSHSISVGLFCVAITACTASRPPSYNLPAPSSLSPAGNYTVGRNENIYAVAQKNGVKLRELIAINGLKPPFALRSGQSLILPSKNSRSEGVYAPAPIAAPLDPINKGYMAPASDSSGGSAGLQSVKTEELPPIADTPVTTPSLSPPKAIMPSAPPTTNWKNTPQPIEPVKAPEDINPQNSQTNMPTSPAPPEPQPINTHVSQPSEAEHISPSQSQSLQPSTSTNPTFGWPVRGTIISAFGPKGQGLDNDGINISAPKGSPVKAAEGGMIAYAGSEMKGFGNLVLIKHEGGWVTAYAHLERLVVAKDNIVAKGDMIGTVGTSGGVSSPQLHFETRQDGRPVDPELVIK
jgi:murein DD-endopeptidase MepM/ murein hydrolase activator NlpD